MQDLENINEDLLKNPTMRFLANQKNDNDDAVF